MKKSIVCAALALLLTASVTACQKQADERRPSENKEKSSNTENGRKKKEERVLNIEIGKRIFRAVLYDNQSVRSFKKMLPMTITMEELNGNEKYHHLDGELPEDSKKVKEIHNGDFMLFGSNSLVLFYKDFKTTYAYTKLGYIEDPEGMASALGQGSITVTFRLEEN